MLTSKGSASDLVLFVERANELWYVARLSRICGAEAKASLKWAIKLLGVDPKPGDLSMSRLKRK